MSIKSYRDLVVWQKAMDVVEEIYSLTGKFPKDEAYGLAMQLRRAAVSIPSNIAEGHTRYSKADFLRFLSIAQGSRAEAETQLILAQRLGYINNECIQKVLISLEEVSKMMYALSDSLSK